MPVIQTRMSLSVHPSAPRNEVIGCTGGTWQVRIAAPPVKGKANRELIDFLSKALGISKGCITIVSGHTSRRKLLAIEGLTSDEIAQRLLPRPSSSDGATQGNLFPRQRSIPG